MYNEKNIDLINRYLRQELSVEELKSVEDRLSNDTEFKDLYMELKSIEIAIKADVMSSKMNMLKDLEAEFKEVPKTKKSSNKRGFWIAFIVAFLSAISVFVFNKLSDKADTIVPPPMAEFSQYIVHENVRSGETVADVDKEKAYNLYVLREFDLAIPMLNTLWAGDQDSLALYYLGVSYHYTNQEEKAKEIFENNNFNDYKIPK